MRWKGIVLLVGLYLIIFGLIFYIMIPKTDNENEVTVNEVFKDIKTDVKSKFSFKNLKNPFGFISKIKITKYLLPTSCYFRKDFECIYFSPNKEDGSLIFQFENNMGKTVNIIEVQAKGDINCSSKFDILLKQADKFYVKLENCTFSGRESKLIINYHQGVPSLYRPSEGRIIVR
jgi:hypothetical protein